MLKKIIRRLCEKINKHEEVFFQEVLDCVRRDDFWGIFIVIFKDILSGLPYAILGLLVLLMVVFSIKSFWPWSVLVPAGIALALFKGNAILEWLHRKASAWWEERKRPCSRCNWCAYAGAYEQASRAVYAAVAECADYLGLKVPHTRSMMETTQGEFPADGIPRFYFKIQRCTQTAETLSPSTMQACLQESVSDACKSTPGLFGNNYLHDLYINKVEILNMHSYLVCVIPWCEATCEYIQNRSRLKIQSQDAPEAEQSQEVLDDEF